MEPFSVQSADLLCRTCLCFIDGNDDCIRITRNVHLCKMYVDCTSLEIIDTDEYPKNICKTCFQQLKIFNEFRQMCKETLMRFKDFLRSREAEFIQKEAALMQGYTTQFNVDKNVGIKKDKMNAIEEKFRDSDDSTYVVTADQNKQFSEESWDISVKSKNKEVFSLRDNVVQRPLYEIEIQEENLDTNTSISGTFKTNEDSELNFRSQENQTVKENNFKRGQAQIIRNHDCGICGKTFKSKVSLSRHRFVHLSKCQHPFECNECGKRFSQKLHLKYHLYRHAGIKNFVCTYCGMQKTTRSELMAHINYHTLEKTWPCESCEKVFNNLGNLKMHIRTVHDRKRDYECRFCNRRFGKAGTLKYHEMRHTGEKPNLCKICGRGFIQPVALSAHMKVHADKY